MTADIKSVGGLEKFNGKSYTMWKDKLLTHVNQLDHKYQTKMLEKRQPEPKVLMANFLRDNPDKPSPPSTETAEEEAHVMRWAVAHWTRGRGDLQNLFNQVLPNFFLSTLPDVVSSRDPCEVFRLLEKDYGQGDAAGLIELTREWSKLTRSPWRDLRSLFAQLKKAKNEINRKRRKLFGHEMVTDSWLCVEVLSQLPSEFWASSISMKKEDFTVDQVEGALRRIFGEKSKSLMDKTQPVAINNVRVKSGQKRKVGGTEGSKCFYCLQSGHFKADCRIMAADRSPEREGGPIFRTDINTAPGAKKARQAKSTPINTIKVVIDEGKSRLNENGKTLLEECADDQEMDDIRSLDPDNGMDFSDTGNSAQTPISPTPPLDLGELEEEVPRQNGPYLRKLKRLRLTEDMWVVDTGAGRAITPDKGWFSGHLRPGQKQCFTYGNGTVSESNLKGTIKMNVLIPQGKMATLKLVDISYDCQCDSNLLSAFFLAQQGYRHLQAKSGEFLFFLGEDSKLMFAAVAIGEVYYLPSMKSSHTRILSAKSTKYGPIIKEWHLRLGHVGKDRLFKAISNQQIEGLPQISYAELKKEVFFCRACAQMKDRRMSYRNMVGTKSKEPLHTLHMDTTGRLRVNGLYGSFGYRYALAVVDDATAYKWYIVVISLKKSQGKLETY